MLDVPALRRKRCVFPPCVHGWASRILFRDTVFLFLRRKHEKTADSRQPASVAAGCVSDRAGSVRARVPLHWADERPRARPRFAAARARGRRAGKGSSVVDAAAARVIGGAGRRRAVRLGLRVPEPLCQSPRHTRHARRRLGRKLRRGIGAASGVPADRRAADGVLFRHGSRESDVPFRKGQRTHDDDSLGHHDGVFVLRARLACQIHGGHRQSRSCLPSPTG